MGITVPVMYDPLGEASSREMPATSEGLPSRCRGTASKMRSRVSFNVGASIFVGKGPGASALTVICLSASLAASTLVSTEKKKDGD